MERAINTARTGIIKTRLSVWLTYIYFFVNGIGMPAGLLIMNLFTPFFYVWLLVKKKKEILLPFVLVLVPFDLIHLAMGVEWKSFIVSNLLFISTYIFTYAFAVFIHSYRQPGILFKSILVMNFVFTLAAIIIFFTPWRTSMWYINKFTATVHELPRLAMFTYEASYYSLMFIPVAYYYLLKVFLRQYSMNPYLILIMVLLPLALSFSLGVLGSSVLTLMLIYLLHWQKLLYRRNFLNLFVYAILVSLAGYIILAVFYPDNPFFIRLNNIISGIDTSARGRTSDSYSMAWKIADERSLWFGAGLGQIKVLAYDIVQKYYAYWGKLDTVRIPNTVAETFAIFGIFGLLTRFILIFYFFFKTRVLTNYYRTALFLFIFIYQFTGSYITNMVEYVIWVLAFSDILPQFNVKRTA